MRVRGKIIKYNHEEYYLPSVNLLSFLFKMLGSQSFKNLFEIQSKLFLTKLKLFQINIKN